jgi:ABC-type protease/lipase transport system fused ATPase/permease subunit
VIIAHRLSTILHVDTIAVLEAGQLIATGTHEQLLRDCALYARLASLQFRETETNGERTSSEELSGEPNSAPAVEPGLYAPG